MKYAKLIDGVFTPAPRKINREIDGVEYTTYNPTDEMLADAGWLEVIETQHGDAPTGFEYRPVYTEQLTETGLVIYQEWELVEVDLTDAEAFEIITGGGIE